MGGLRWVIGQVQEERDTFQGTVLFEIPGEESTRFQVHTHSSKNDREVLFVTVMNILSWSLNETSLSANLSGDFIMR